MMSNAPCRQVSGFTLLELMVVLLMIGLAAGFVLFNAFTVSQSDRLNEEVKRLQVIVDMASDYAVLNQLQLGLYVNESEGTYHFARLDDEQEWQVFESHKTFKRHELPENFEFELMLDDLPWEDEDSLFDRDLFDESLSVSDDRVSIGEEDLPPPPPQILILSSGDITPFSLIFAYEPDFSDDAPVYYRLNGHDTVPLVREGPLDDPEQEVVSEI